MTLSLFIIAAIGLLIFVFAYLIIVIASFRHHTVTGLISLLPGINLVVLPSIWARAGKAFIVSIIGLALALPAWYSGGQNYLTHLLHPSPASTSEITLDQIQTEQTAPKATPQNVKESVLPQKPLYYIVYEEINPDTLVETLNDSLRITLVDDRSVEGKNVKVENASLLLQTHEQNQNQIVKIALQHIRKVEKLVSKQ